MIFFAGQLHPSYIFQVPPPAFQQNQLYTSLIHSKSHILNVLKIANIYATMVFIDSSAVLDTVDHELLPGDLIYIGVEDTVY